MATEVLLPLESNPEVMNKFLHILGVSKKWSVVDVMGLDPELMSWVPRPVLAVLLLFPISPAYEEHKLNEEKRIKSNGQVVSNDIFYVKQKLSNACGTIALIHSVTNNIEKISLDDGPLKNYISEASKLDAVARGELLEKNQGIIQGHKDLSQEGQTAANPDEPVNHHFIAFVQKNGVLYELDGRKEFPINHGPTSDDTLLEDAAKVIKEFMARDPDEVRFTVVALAATD